MIGRVSNVLPLKDGAQTGKRAKRLQVACTRVQVLPCFRMERRIEPSKHAEVSPLAPDIAGLKENATRQFSLKAGVPLLHVRSWCMLVQTKIARKARSRGVRKPVLCSKRRQRRAVRFIDLSLDPIQHKIINFVRDLRVEIE